MKPHKKYCGSLCLIYTKKIVNYLCTADYKLTRLICKQQHINNLQSITPGPKLSWKTTSFFEGNKQKVIIINVLKLHTISMKNLYRWKKEQCFIIIF